MPHAGVTEGGGHMKVHTVTTQRDKHRQSVIAESYSPNCSSLTGLDSALPVCGGGTGNGRLRCHGGRPHCVARPGCSVAFPAAHHLWCDDPVITVGEHPKGIFFSPRGCIDYIVM